MAGKITGKKVRGFLLDGVFFLLGSVINAISVNMFTAPNNIAPGGLTGMATMANYLTDGLVPIGLGILVMNIPIFIWGFCAAGWRFIAKTLAATVISSVMIDLTAPYIPQYQGDMLLTTVFGGLLAGFGLALIFMRGGTTGGTDMIASLIGKYFRHISMGRLLLAIDMVIVVISAFVYQNYESPLYATIIIFITAKVIDAVLYGVNSGTGKMMFIISPQNEEIAAQIMEKLDRGVTELKSRGGYSKQEGTMLLCAVKRQEVYRTYDIVHSVDPDAFIIVGEASEVTGEGFHEIAASKAYQQNLKKLNAGKRKK